MAQVTYRRLSLVGAGIVALSSISATASDLPFIHGVDASFIPQIEDLGGVYYDDGNARDLLLIFRDQGVNCVRLRLWHTPAEGYCDLAHTLALAQRINAAGMLLLLDFHYSDWWADPGNQTKPVAWAGFGEPELSTALHDYSRDVIAALNAQGTLPDLVQVGNEISNGFLWDDGRVGGSFNGNWPQFAWLLNSAIAGVNDALDPGQSIPIMLHIDPGGDNGACRWFYDNAEGYGVPYDLIGLSFYPWWHGTLNDLEWNLADLSTRYGKPIVVVETAYPWTLGWGDDTHNIVGLESQLHSGYPATVVGQERFLCAVQRIVGTTPGGAGMFYWAPEWIPVSGLGTPWENLALFDFDGHRLDSMRVFAKAYDGNDLIAVAAFQACFTGAIPPPVEEPCRPYDFDCDSDVDGDDFSVFESAISGP